MAKRKSSSVVVRGIGPDSVKKRFESKTVRQYEERFKNLPYKTPTISQKLFEEFSGEFWHYVATRKIQNRIFKRLYLEKYDLKWRRLCRRLKGLNPEVFFDYWSTKLTSWSWTLLYSDRRRGYGNRRRQKDSQDFKKSES